MKADIDGRAPLRSQFLTKQDASVQWLSTLTSREMGPALRSENAPSSATDAPWSSYRLWRSPVPNAASQLHPRRTFDNGAVPLPGVVALLL